MESMAVGRAGRVVIYYPHAIAVYYPRRPITHSCPITLVHGFTLSITDHTKTHSLTPRLTLTLSTAPGNEPPRGSEINDRTAEQLQYRTSTVQHPYASAAAAAMCCGEAWLVRGWCSRARPDRSHLCRWVSSSSSAASLSSARPCAPCEASRASAPWLAPPPSCAPFLP